MRVPKVSLLPLAVLVTTFSAPMAIIIPTIFIAEVVGWEPPPWWMIAQLWFLPGYISISDLRFTPCWTLLRFADDPYSAAYPIFGSIAINDTIAYLTLSLSWLAIGLILYFIMLKFSLGKLAFRHALALALLLLLAELTFPYLILVNVFNVELWGISAIIPAPVPGIIASLGIIRKH